jgi:hypothetical protein
MVLNVEEKLHLYPPEGIWAFYIPPIPGWAI